MAHVLGCEQRLYLDRLGASAFITVVLAPVLDALRLSREGRRDVRRARPHLGHAFQSSLAFLRRLHREEMQSSSVFARLDGRPSKVQLSFSFLDKRHGKS